MHPYMHLVYLTEKCLKNVRPLHLSLYNKKLKEDTTMKKL